MAQPKKINLEWLLSSEHGFNMDSMGGLSPTQRAVCRVSDGLPLGELWADANVRDAFGGVQPEGGAPETMVVLAGIRSLKSTMAAAKVIQMSQSINLSGTRISDEIRIPVLSVDKDSARQTYNHIVDTCKGRPALKLLIESESESEQALWLKHPSGRLIEVRVVALAKYGSTLVSRWLGGVVFDEAPRMSGESDSVKNLTESRRAIAGRILPGGQEWMIGSPYAPFGPIYDLYTERFRSPDSDLVIVKAPGPAMNPVWWTPERVKSTLIKDPAAHRTDCLAEFSDPEEALYPSELIEKCMSGGYERLPPRLDEGIHYVAAMDPATRSNAWTLVILECYGLGGEFGSQAAYRVALAKQWIGSQANPLSPNRVLSEISAICQEYGTSEAITDQYSFDSLQDLAGLNSLTLQGVTWDTNNRLKFAEDVKVLLQQGRLVLPKDRVLRNDMVQVRKRVTQNGVTLVLPRSGDGRHCDFVPSLCLACANPPELPTPIVPGKTVEDKMLESLLNGLNRDENEGAALRLMGLI